MSIYTKTGDSGATALIGGQRLKKYHPRVEAYGTVDELNACLSVAAKQVRDAQNRQVLLAMQHQLFWLGAELADDRPVENPNVRRIGDAEITALEQAIDRCMAALPPVTGFVLPGDTPAGSQLHLARTVARRAERRVVRLAEESGVRAEVLRYLNRLSDCLYALARSEDQRAKNDAVVEEIKRRYLAAAGEVLITTPPVQAPDEQMAADVRATSGAAAWTHVGHSARATYRPVAAETLDFALAHALLREVLTAARELSVPVAVTIVDLHGNPVMSYRMPDSLLIALELAPKKAFSAVALRTATHLLGPAVRPGADLYQLETSSGGKIVTFGGGYPLYRAGRLIGGLGVSGGTAEQDRQIAERAVTQCHMGNE